MASLFAISIKRLIMRKITVCLLVSFIISYFLYDVYFSSSNEIKKVDLTGEIKDKIPSVGKEKSTVRRASNTSTEKQRCENFTLDVASISEWKKIKKIEISSYLVKLSSEEVDGNILDQVYTYSGIGWLKGRYLDNYPEKSSFLSEYIDADLKLADHHVLAPISKHLKNGQYQSILNFFSTNISNLNAAYIADDGEMLPIISYLIKYGDKKRSGEVFNLINNLSLLNEKVRYIDLITATKTNYDLRFIEMLFDLSSLNANKVFEVLGTYETLATIASKNDNVPALLFWLEMGSNPSPDHLTDNALDLLIAPELHTDLTLYKKAFLTLVEKGVVAHSTTTYTSLSKWLPKEYLIKYNEQLSGGITHTLSVEERKKIRQYISKIFYIATDSGMILPEPDRNKKMCIMQAGKQLTALIFKTEPIDFDINKDLEEQSNAKLSRSMLEESQKSADVIINNFENNKEDSFETKFAALKLRTDLTGKIAFMHVKREKWKENSEKHVEKVLNNAPASSDFFKMMMNLVYKEMDYRGAYSLINEMNVDKDERIFWLNSILNQVIINKYDLDFVSKLIDDGALFGKYIVFNLTRNGNLNAVKYLRGHGLNIYALHPYGYNVIRSAVESKSIDMLTYFIANGVNLNLPPHGTDALDIAIEQLPKVEDGMDYIDQLIYNGMNIQQSHRELASSLNTLNKSLFYVLTERHPSLL